MEQAEYPEEYAERIFYLWYDGGRKLTNSFLNILPKSPDGRIPAKATLISWINTRGWTERADALDGEISLALDNEVIEKRKEMYRKQVEIADELVKKGMEFLNNKDNGIKTDASAIRAIDLGLSTQRVSTGMAESYAKISKMSDEQLNNELQKLIGGKKLDIIDGDILEEE